ncbi:ribosomal protection-like ABC-F family protein [Neobacillus terrae]|uniref:ribosomal protection-like ABC-F family protein n=1 Tax=Neobacillus terrae TaxID=3034837 RepID=UPI001408C0BB|nr:ABC-F type ribosomal protection protein [Neobacillus terrae]NHM31018.1 ABC-F type ribosomal protection protein [Neobacillus terrae]
MAKNNNLYEHQLLETVLNVKKLTKSFADLTIINEIDLQIKRGDRIGLVGYNGSGKTTLAKLLIGIEKADRGSIEFLRKINIGYLPQSIEISEEIADMDQDYSHTLKQLSMLGLQKLQAWDDDRLKNLSGGEKLKLALSLIWHKNTDFLLLDEPTNHLDFKGMEWLATELEKFDGPAIIISHDRHFLDRTVNQIYELRNSKLHVYNGNYSDYQKEKHRQKEVQLHQYETQMNMKRKIESQIQQLKNWSEKAHRESTKQGSPSEKRQIGFKEYHRVKAKRMDQQVKSKMKRLEQELDKNKIEKPDEEASISFQFESKSKRGRRIIEAKGITKRYGTRILYKDSHFTIQHGERIALLGENGCGKTTLIKNILGDAPLSSGEIWCSDSLKIAYLSQDVLDLPPKKTILEALDLNTREETQTARTLLANLGLNKETIGRKVGTLSLGERTRVKLADLLMKEYDLLILDEPTNHLDLPSREQLEETLNLFNGTVIAVSHDFYFINKICDKVLAFENDKIQRYELSPYEHYHRKNQLEESGIRTEETLMVIENRITALLGELSLLDPISEKYRELDTEFKRLLSLKKALF